MKSKTRRILFVIADGGSIQEESFFLDKPSAAAPNDRIEAVSGGITVRQRADAPLSESRKRLPISGIAIESSGRPTMVVGWSSSGKSRVEISNA